MAFESRVVFPSAARTASPTPEIFYVPDDAENLEVLIDASAIAATPSVVFNIDLDIDGTWTSFLASAAVVAVSTARMRIGPLMPTTANVSAPTVLPRAVRIRPIHGDADSITYSVTVWAR